MVKYMGGLEKSVKGSVDFQNSFTFQFQITLPITRLHGGMILLERIESREYYFPKSV